MGLTRNIYQGVHVRIAPINDKDINSAIDISLPSQDEWSGNRVLRTSEVQHFKTRVQQALDQVKVGEPISHSIIFRTVARYGNSLSRSNAGRRILLVYSNLYENSTLSLYGKTASAELDGKPTSLRQALAKSVQLDKLAGIQVWLMYSPKGYDDNNRYVGVADAYRQVLEARKASVFVASSFSPQ
ncbi:hypothetical protein [Mucilaginibacter sp. HD30]